MCIATVHHRQSNSKTAYCCWTMNITVVVVVGGNLVLRHFYGGMNWFNFLCDGLMVYCSPKASRTFSVGAQRELFRSSNRAELPHRRVSLEAMHV